MESIYVSLREGQSYITLQSLLQYKGVISTGGMIKIFLAENEVKVNGEIETRRGRKLYPNDVIEVLNKTFVIKST